jgi:hypothetical protein
MGDMRVTHQNIVDVVREIEHTIRGREYAFSSVSGPLNDLRTSQVYKQCHVYVNHADGYGYVNFYDSYGVWGFHTLDNVRVSIEGGKITIEHTNAYSDPIKWIVKVQ